MPIPACLIAALPALFLSGEETLDLGAAIQRALAKNPDALREVANVDTANASVLRTQSQFDYTLTADANYARTFQFGGLSQSTPIDRLSYDAGITRGLETANGGSLSLTFQGSRTSFTSLLGGAGAGTGAVPSAIEQITWSNGLALQLTHPLLRGMGLDVVAKPRQAAEQRVTAALANRRARVVGVVRDLALAYWELAYAVEDVAIKRKGLQLAREQLELTQAQIRVGRLSQVEEYAVKATIAQNEGDLVTAELLQRQRSRDLRRLLGEPVDPHAPMLGTPPPPAIQPTSIDSGTEAEKAVVENPALAALRAGVRAAELDRDAVDNMLLPDLSFVGSVGTTGVKPTFRDSMEDVVTVNTPQYAAGLRFSWQLGNRDVTGQKRQAEAARRKSEIDVAALEIDTKLFAMRYADELGTASKRLELAAVGVEFAQKNLDAEKAKFEVGRTTNYEVLRRQQDLTAAQGRRVRAMVDFLEAQAQLLGVSGRILETYGVTLK